VYIADHGNNVVEKVTPLGQLSVVAGVPGDYGLPTEGTATSSHLESPMGVAVDQAGNVYIADQGSDVIEKVTPGPGGQLSVFAGIAAMAGPATEGPATSSHMRSPSGVAVDQARNVYIADQSNGLVEKVTSGGMLSFFAGNGTGGTPQPGPATGTSLPGVSGVATDAAGNVYIAVPGDKRFDASEVAEVTGGTLSIIAGTDRLARTRSAGPRPARNSTSHSGSLSTRTAPCMWPNPAAATRSIAWVCRPRERPASRR
jgi:hypothetical protein